jgi:hypothetical protein
MADLVPWIAIKSISQLSGVAFSCASDESTGHNHYCKILLTRLTLFLHVHLLEWVMTHEMNWSCYLQGVHQDWHISDLSVVEK